MFQMFLLFQFMPILFFASVQLSYMQHLLQSWKLQSWNHGNYFPNLCPNHSSFIFFYQSLRERDGVHALNQKQKYEIKLHSRSTSVTRHYSTWETTVQTGQRTNQEDGQKVKHSINQENNKAQTLHNCHGWQGFTMN